MKKLLSATLILLALTACGGADQQESDTPQCEIIMGGGYEGVGVRIDQSSMPGCPGYKGIVTGEQE